MADASRDQNSIPTLLATLDSDGETVVKVQVNATNHGLAVDDSQGGVDNGPVDAPRDENFVPALIALSADDGVTPVVVYADSQGRLLINSN